MASSEMALAAHAAVHLTPILVLLLVLIRHVAPSTDDPSGRLKACGA